MTQRTSTDNEYGAWMQELALQAGALVLSIAEGPLRQRSKRDKNDIVTEADEAANTLLMHAIAQRYPDHKIIAEETADWADDSQDVPGPGLTWVIDPVDGTVNYASKHPLFGISIALLEKERAVCGVIFLPALNQLYYAEHGKGAFLNGTRIHCSEKDQLEYSIGCIPARPRSEPWFGKLYGAALYHGYWVNAYGSASVTAAFVASGKRDWLITSEGRIWDRVPTALLLVESGAILTDSDGKPWHFGVKDIVAAPPRIHPQLIALIAQLKQN